MPNKLTPEDIEHLREEYRTMLLDEERVSEGGPDVVMASLGYVNLWTDGVVTFYCGGAEEKQTLGRFDDDGDWTPNDDDDDYDGDDDGEDAAGEGEE